MTLHGEKPAETQRLLLRERFRLPIRAPALWAGAISVLVSVLVPSGTQTAVANGDTRTIRLFHVHTKETIEATYRVNGSYDSSVLKQLNWFLRDWRRDEPINMDPRLFDVVWEAYRSAGAGSEYVTVMSAYRSPQTNAMLRRRSRAVAEYSQHMLGKAMDTSMPGMSMEQIREMGMKMQRGGVGYYPSAGTPFVHLDVGSVRSWPRMSYDQLARLFPDGKTVHLPTNGQPMARYEEARAEIAAYGGVAPPSSTSTGFFAWLFGGGSAARDGGEEEDAAPVAAPRMQARRGKGNMQVASLSPRLPGGSGPSTTGDDGGRDFFAQQANRAAARSAPQPVAAAPVPEAPRPEEQAPASAAPPARTQVASLAPVAKPEEIGRTGLRQRLARSPCAAAAPDRSPSACGCAAAASASGCLCLARHRARATGIDRHGLCQRAAAAASRPDRQPARSLVDCHASTSAAGAHGENRGRAAVRRRRGRSDDGSARRAPDRWRERNQHRRAAPRSLQLPRAHRERTDCTVC